MKKLYMILLFYFTGSLFAQDHPSSRNGIGWDCGISYRRYINNDLWLGAAVCGDARIIHQNDTQSVTTHFIKTDSTVYNNEYSIDSGYSYSGTIKIEIGRTIFHYTMIELNAIILASYSYQNYKYLNGGTNPRVNSTPRNIVSGGIALEPMVWVAKSLSIGTDFGVQYLFTFGKQNSSYKDYNTTDTYSSSSKGTYLSHEIKTFGNISLTTGLIAFIWF